MPPHDDDDSNTEPKEPPKSSCATYVAEGDKLFRKGDFRKAIESYTLALQQAEVEEVDKKQSFYCRALCHLNLGDSEAALTDAEEALDLEPSYTKGLWVKAEALYAMGDFEYALLFYHRGHQARSDFAEFRIGIQKSQEAIENAIGKEDGEDLTNDGDLDMFFNRNLTQNYITFSEKRAREKKSGGGGTRRDEQRKREEAKAQAKKDKQGGPSKKNSRRLLGRIYADKEFLQELFQDGTITNQESESGKKIKEVTSEALQYLGKREEFWRQQDPGRLHNKKQERTSSGRVVTSANLKKNDPGRYMYRQLERIDEDMEKKKYKLVEKRCKEALDEARSYHEEELDNKQQYMATLYALLGSALLEQGKYEQAEKQFLKDYDVSEEINHYQGKSRALDNLGRVCVKLNKLEKAIQYWESKLQLMQQSRPKTQASHVSETSEAGKAKTAKEMSLERTWLYHEIGRCHLELGNNSEAKEYGERALASGKKAEDDAWQLNALVLTGKAELNMEEYQASSETFEKALEMAKELELKDAQKSIEATLRDVNNKIVRGVKTEETGEEEAEQERKRKEQEESEQQKKTETKEEAQAKKDDSEKGELSPKDESNGAKESDRSNNSKKSK